MAMNTDTKAIIGTMVGTGLALAGLLSAQIASVNARIDDLDDKVNTRIDDLDDKVNTRIDDMRDDMRDMRDTMERFDARLDAVEVAFGKVDQRLLTIERVILPPQAPNP